MSLYHETATILSSSGQKGSLKSLVYAKDAGLKSKPAHVYALISEAAKFDVFFKEVVESAGILALEPKLTPVLALLLVHDHFFAKNGIAASASHPLRQSIEKHKARLQSEFTRARLRRKVADIEQLKKILIEEKGTIARSSPRWARVNLIKTTLEEVLGQHFEQYQRATSVEEVVTTSSSQKVFHIDNNIPDLIGFPPNQDLTRTQAYINGSIILQDKASCFPAHLLLGNASHDDVGDVIDGCAAPGNKTTHAAAILSAQNSNSTIYGCERDATRSKTLQLMVRKASAEEIVTVLERQDFLALDPNDVRFANVTHLLLDPSCSGSGILGREDIPKLSLPIDPRQHTKVSTSSNRHGSVKKRKREPETSPDLVVGNDDEEVDPTSEAKPLATDRARLDKLSNLQSLIVEHAFRFPAARKVTYSTCSIHEEENEAVVDRVLRSKIGTARGWRVLKRDEQVEGMRSWKQRGISSLKAKDDQSRHQLSVDEMEACIRCSPNDVEGTMGFFVCGFVREPETNGVDTGAGSASGLAEEDEWEGFSDS